MLRCGDEACNDGILAFSAQVRKREATSSGGALSQESILPLDAEEVSQADAGSVRARICNDEKQHSTSSDAAERNLRQRPDSRSHIRKVTL